MDFVAKNIPPQLQIGAQMSVSLRCDRLASGRVKVYQPRFQLANEVQDLNAFAESLMNKAQLYTYPINQITRHPLTA